ncbi:MAG: phosphatase PAP2 family protein [Lentimicrobiaceae bacterium]|nr:phosphatase PAP2 family protein [Lentimicrobiaceae bacterium]
MPRQAICCFYLLLFLFSNNCFSQNENQCKIRFDGDYIKNYWKSGVTTITQVKSFETKEWIAVGAVATSTALIYVYDKTIFSFFDRQFTDKQAKNSTNITDAFGNGFVALPLFAVMYIVGNNEKNCHLRKTSLVGLQAFVFSAGSSLILKELTKRSRPSQNENPHIWQGPFGNNHRSAFPSAHTAIAFSVATVFSEMYRESVWVGITAYTLAGLTGIGRLVKGKHWASDVVAGAALGYFIGKGVVLFNKKQQQKNPFSLKTSFNENGFGIALTF